MNAARILFNHLLAFALLPFTALAQVAPLSQGHGVGLINGANSADEAWTALVALAQSKPTQGGPPSLRPDEPRAFDQLIEASQGAKAFRGRFPDDPRAAEALKLEALLALHGVQLGAVTYRQTAFALGSAYRSNKKNSDRDRFEVAFMMDGLLLAEELNGRRFIDDGAKFEQLADTLRAELGDTDDVFGLYVSILRTTDVATATRVANKMLGQKNAPEWVQSQAQIALDRSKLIGRSVALKLITMGGGTVDLAKQNDRPTVVFFWHASDAPADFAALEHFKPSFRLQPRYIYVGLGTQPPISDQPLAGSPFADSHCFEEEQAKKPSSMFKVQQTPYAFVLDAAGRVVGYGPPEKIATLLDAAAL